MRNAFIEELVAAARGGKDVALVVGDLGYKVVEPFADAFPDRFFNAGVAEQNMMGLAAGMASEGVHVFVYSIANFPTFRCAEQVRNDVDYHNLPVTVVSVGGGLAYGNLGYSHHAIQDYALMRVLPNMLIASPGDPMEVRACIRYLVNNPRPSYLRLGKAGETCIHETIPEVQPGKWLSLRGGDSEESAVLVTGAIAQDVIFERLSLPRRDLKSAIYSLPLWGMASKVRQKEYLMNLRKLAIVEDHLTDGGLGSWILECLAMDQIDSISFSDIRLYSLDSVVCGMVGSESILKQKTLRMSAE